MSEKLPPVTPLEVEFEGDNKLIAKRKENFIQAIQDVRSYADRESPETDLTMEMEGIVGKLIDNHLEYAKEELGIHLERRTFNLQMSKIAFVSREEYRKVMQRTSKGYIHGSGGFHDAATGEIFVLNEGSVAQRIYAANHEITHELEGKQYAVSGSKRNPSLEVRGSGYVEYRRDGTDDEDARDRGVMIYEMFTDMLNIEALDYMRQHGGADYLSGVLSGFYAGILFMDTVIERAQERLPERPVRQILYRGMYMRDRQALKVLDEAFGEGTAEDFLDATQVPMHPISYERWLADLGIETDAYAKKLALYEQNEAIRLSSGIELRTEVKPSPHFSANVYSDTIEVLIPSMALPLGRESIKERIGVCLDVPGEKIKENTHATGFSFDVPTPTQIALEDIAHKLKALLDTMRQELLSITDKDAP